MQYGRRRRSAGGPGLHPVRGLHDAGHDRHQRVLHRAAHRAQLRKPRTRIRRRLGELHDVILDHRHLEPRMAGEPERAGADLPERRQAPRILGQHLGVGGQPRPVPPVQGKGVLPRKIAVQGVVIDPPRDRHLKFQRGRRRSAAGRERQDLRAEPDADDRALEHKRGVGEAHFFAQRWNVACARGAPYAAAEQDQAVPDRVPVGERRALGERAEVAKTDAAPLEMVLDQAEILGGCVLDDGDELHAADAMASSTALRKSAGATVSRPTRACAKNRSTASPASDTAMLRRDASRSYMVRGGVTKKSPVMSASRIRSRRAPSSRTYASIVPPAPVWRAASMLPSAPGSSIPATNASVPISSSWWRAARDSSSAVISPGTAVIPRHSANPARSPALTDSRVGAVPKSSFSVTTRCAAESSARRASLAWGTFNAASMSAGFMSTSTVPWKKRVSSSKKPPVPESLRPLTSMSLRGRYRAGTPSRLNPAAAASQSRRVTSASEPMPSVARLITSSQPSCPSSK